LDVFKQWLLTVIRTPKAADVGGNSFIVDRSVLPWLGWGSE